MCSCQLLCILQFPIYGKSSNLQLLMDQVQRCYRSLSKFLKGPFWGRHFSPFSWTIFCPLCLPDPSICLPTTQRFTAWVTRQKKALPKYTALRELKEWCLINRLTPHTSKSEAMLISGRNPPVNIPPILSETLQLNGYRNHDYWEWPSMRNWPGLSICWNSKNHLLKN